MERKSFLRSLDEQTYVRAARDSVFKNVAGGLAGLTVATATIFFPRIEAVNPARSDILRAEKQLG